MSTSHCRGGGGVRIQGIYTDTEAAPPSFKTFKYDGKYYKNILYMKHFVKIVRKEELHVTMLRTLCHCAQNIMSLCSEHSTSTKLPKSRVVWVRP